MATHSSTLAWKIPWMEEPSRLQSVGSQRVGHNWATSFFFFFFFGGSDGKEFTCSAGDPDLIPGLGQFPGEGNGSPLQYSCLENSTD